MSIGKLPFLPGIGRLDDFATETVTAITSRTATLLCITRTCTRYGRSIIHHVVTHIQCNNDCFWFNIYLFHCSIVFLYAPSGRNPRELYLIILVQLLSVSIILHSVLHENNLAFDEVLAVLQGFVVGFYSLNSIDTGKVTIFREEESRTSVRLFRHR